MSTYESPFRDRVYQRKFDWDEAKRLRASGMTIKQVAAHFGVSQQAVFNATNDRARAKVYAYQSVYQARKARRLTAVCECGNPMDKRSHTCRSCRADATTKERITPDGNLICTKCGEHKPSTSFHFDGRNAAHNFRRNHCIQCESANRKETRNRHKVPCAYCGAPALPPKDKGPRGYYEPRCRKCFYQGHRSVRAA